MTSGVRGGADLMVQVVLRLESQLWDWMEVGARERTARRASSEAWDRWAVRPCLAAMMADVDECFGVSCVCTNVGWIEFTYNILIRRVGWVQKDCSKPYRVLGIGRELSVRDFWATVGKFHGLFSLRWSCVYGLVLGEES